MGKNKEYWDKLEDEIRVKKANAERQIMYDEYEVKEIAMAFASSGNFGWAFDKWWGASDLNKALPQTGNSSH